MHLKLQYFFFSFELKLTTGSSLHVAPTGLGSQLSFRYCAVTVWREDKEEMKKDIHQKFWTVGTPLPRGYNVHTMSSLHQRKEKKGVSQHTS